jgi:fluoroquinolone transport system permease protein
LRWLVGYPALIALLVRWGLPVLADRVWVRFRLDLTSYDPLLLSWLLLMTPVLAGVVIGFLLLDERDDRTLTALQVTPLTLKGYLVYRVGMPMALSAVMSGVVLHLSGRLTLPLLPLLGAALGTAPLAPLCALFLGAFAANKVQGFALMKAAGVLVLPPLIAYFVRSPWQLAFGVVPLYWPAKAFWMFDAGEAPGLALPAGGSGLSEPSHRDAAEALRSSAAPLKAARRLDGRLVWPGEGGQSSEISAAADRAGLRASPGLRSRGQRGAPSPWRSPS